MTKTFKMKIVPTDVQKIKSKKSSKEKVVYHINRDDEKTINSSLFKDTYNAFVKKYGVHNILVRAQNNQGIFTFKSFDGDELNFTDFHDYYENKVKSDKEFDYFYSLEMTVIRDV